MAWDPEDLLELLRIPRLHAAGGGGLGLRLRGDEGGAGRAFRSAGVAGDQQAALFGQMCTTPGMVKCTFGTGSFMLLQTGAEPMASQNRLLTTVAWRREGETAYALEGSMLMAGAVVQWLRDGLGIIQRSSDVEALAASVPDSGGVVMVPAFAGLGAPRWDQGARGALLGMTRGTTKAHIARAALEGIACRWWMFWRPCRRTPVCR